MDRLFIMDIEARLTLLVERYGSKGRCYTVDAGDDKELRFWNKRLTFAILIEIQTDEGSRIKTRTLPINAIHTKKFVELLDELIHLIKNEDNCNFASIQNECYHKLDRELEGC